MAQLDLQVMMFNPDENENFDKSWLGMISIYNLDRGLVFLFTQADAELVRLFAMHMKSRFEGETFVGTNASGNNEFGMRWALPEDLLQDDASATTAPLAAPISRVLDWRQEAEMTAGEWFAGRRNWISSRPANTGTFDDAADTRVELRDNNNSQKWGMVFLAIQEINPDPILKAVLRDFGAKSTHAIVNCRWHVTSSEFQIHKFDEPMLADDTDPLRVGLELQTRQAGAPKAGTDPNNFADIYSREESFIQPLAVTFPNQRRIIANNTIGNPPGAAPTAFPRPTATA